jgi:REP element-mobilizing transposase RayT
MILAHHLIFTGYGHWLPNDPRGSLSPEIRKAELEDLGPIHYGRKPVQPSRREIWEFYQAAEERLDYPVLWFERDARHVLGEAFGTVVRREGLTCYACAVLADHAHLLVRRHRRTAKEMISLFKTASARALLAGGHVPTEHPVWSHNDYVAYKDSPASIRATIAYILGNLAKHKVERQDWDFVKPYDGWPRSWRP